MRYLDKAMTIKVKDENKDKNNKLMPFRTDEEKPAEKKKCLNALPVYDDRYIKTKIRIYGDKVYTNFRDLNVPEDDIEYELFKIISTDSFLVYVNKYYLQVYLDNYAYKTANKQMTDYLDDNLFED